MSALSNALYLAHAFDRLSINSMTMKLDHFPQGRYIEPYLDYLLATLEGKTDEHFHDQTIDLQEAIFHTVLTHCSDRGYKMHMRELIFMLPYCVQIRDLTPIINALKTIDDECIDPMTLFVEAIGAWITQTNPNMQSIDFVFSCFSTYASTWAKPTDTNACLTRYSQLVWRVSQSIDPTLAKRIFDYNVEKEHILALVFMIPYVAHDLDWKIVRAKLTSIDQEITTPTTLFAEAIACWKQCTNANPQTAASRLRYFADYALEWEDQDYKDPHELQEALVASFCYIVWYIAERYPDTASDASMLKVLYALQGNVEVPFSNPSWAEELTGAKRTLFCCLIQDPNLNQEVRDQFIDHLLRNDAPESAVDIAITISKSLSYHQLTKLVHKVQTSKNPKTLEKFAKLVKSNTFPRELRELLLTYSTGSPSAANILFATATQLYLPLEAVRQFINSVFVHTVNEESKNALQALLRTRWLMKLGSEYLVETGTETVALCSVLQNFVKRFGLSEIYSDTDVSNIVVKNIHFTRVQRIKSRSPSPENMPLAHPASLRSQFQLKKSAAILAPIPVTRKPDSPEPELSDGANN